jgi:glyoxylase-like metal-dependent hydrolase (beta-lactamase superfamily II)
VAEGRVREVVEIIPGVYDIDLGLVHAYLYKEADRVTLIDTGLATSATQIIDALAAIGAKPRGLGQIVVTHYHIDHMGALAEMAERTGAQVLAHVLDAPVVRGEQPEEEPRLSDLEKPFHEDISKNVMPARRCAVDRELVDGAEIELDGGATVVHVPGHTAGSIALYVPKRRVLFVGDAAARLPDGQLIVGVFNVDPAQTRASFRKLAALEFDAAFFGHGSPLDREVSLAFRRVAEKLGR